MRRLVVLSTLLLSTLGTSGALAEDLVVIVNPASGVQQMTRDEVIDVFMGRYRKLPSGNPALPLDVVSAESARADFYQRLVSKSLAEINAYWARILFTGRATPPQRVDDASEVLDIVAENKGAIGYVPRSRADGRVRVVLELRD
jgi:ABC-type phosphate transport system substrate-binding protein